MRKKLLAILLAAVLLLGLLPTAALAVTAGTPSLVYCWLEGDGNGGLSLPSSPNYRDSLAVAPGCTNAVAIYFYDGTNYALVDVTASGVVTATKLNNTTGWYEISATGFGNGTLSYTDNSTTYTMSVVSTLPDFGFYTSDATVNETTYLSTLELTALPTTVYFCVSPNLSGITISSVTNPGYDWASVGSVAGNGLSVPINITAVPSDGREWFDFDFVIADSSSGTTQTFTRHEGIRIIDKLPGLKCCWLEGDGNGGLSLPQPQNRNYQSAISTAPGWSQCVAIYFYNGTNYALVDVTASGDVVTATKLNNTTGWYEIGATGFGNGTLSYTDNSTTYTMSVVSTLPDIGLYTNPKPSENSFVQGDVVITGLPTTLYYCVRDDLIGNLSIKSGLNPENLSWLEFDQVASNGSYIPVIINNSYDGTAGHIFFQVEMERTYSGGSSSFTIGYGAQIADKIPGLKCCYLEENNGSFRVPEKPYYRSGLNVVPGWTSLVAMYYFDGTDYTPVEVTAGGSITAIQMDSNHTNWYAINASGFNAGTLSYTNNNGTYTMSVTPVLPDYGLYTSSTPSEQTYAEPLQIDTVPKQFYLCVSPDARNYLSFTGATTDNEFVTLGSVSSDGKTIPVTINNSYDGQPVGSLTVSGTWDSNPETFELYFNTVDRRPGLKIFYLDIGSNGQYVLPEDSSLGYHTTMRVPLYGGCPFAAFYSDGTTYTPVTVTTTGNCFTLQPVNTGTQTGWYDLIATAMGSGTLSYTVNGVTYTVDVTVVAPTIGVYDANNNLLDNEYGTVVVEYASGTATTLRFVSGYQSVELMGGGSDSSLISIAKVDASTVTLTIPATTSGNFTANVTIAARDGSDFTNDYFFVFNDTNPITVTMRWASAQQTLTYTGEPAAITAPTVTLSEGTYSEETNGAITYSYATSEDGEYEEGLPTDAGTYYVKAALAETEGYTAGETASALVLTISKATPDIGSVTLSSSGKIYKDATITLVRADETVSGTLVLDEGQTLVDGTNSYNWTFTPEDETNYNTVTGTVPITVFADSVVSVKATVYSEETPVTGEEVAVTVDGTSLKVVGKITQGNTVTLTYTTERGTADTVQITDITQSTTFEFDGVTYTVDVSALEAMPANVEVASGTVAPVEEYKADDDASEEVQKMAEAVNTALTSDAAKTQVEGLGAAASENVSSNGEVATQSGTITAEEAKEKLAESGVDTENATVTTVLQPTLQLEITVVTEDSFTLEINPVYNVIVTTDPDNIKTEESAAGANDKNAVVAAANMPMTVTTPVTITVPVPESYLNSADSSALFVKHEKKDASGNVIATYYYPVTVDADNSTITFVNPHGFSDFTFKTDARKGSINFVDIGATVEYLPSNLGEALPTAPAAAGKTFAGWKISGNTYLTLTEELLTLLSGDDDKLLDAEAAFNSVGGSVIVSGNTDGSDKEEEDPCDSFTDIDKDAWYHDAVAYVLTNGLMSGNGDGTFAPEAKLSRAMLCQILYNKEGKPVVTAENPFDDVPANAWYTDAVIWAYENNVISGYGNGKFGPTDDITREQLATILWRYDGEKTASASLNAFSDAGEIHSYASNALRWAYENGVVSGKGNGILDPLGNAKRCEVAQMLMNYLEK